MYDYITLSYLVIIFYLQYVWFNIFEKPLNKCDNWEIRLLVMLSAIAWKYL